MKRSMLGHPVSKDYGGISDMPYQFKPPPRSFNLVLELPKCQQSISAREVCRFVNMLKILDLIATRLLFSIFP